MGQANLVLATSGMTADRLGPRLREVAPHLEIAVVGAADTDPSVLARAEVAYYDAGLWNVDLGKSGLTTLVDLPKLRWLHTFMGGTDHALYRRVLDRGAVLTHSAGARTRPMAEYVMAMMLLVVRRMDSWWLAQRDREWRPHRAQELGGKTVGVVGVGRIGGEVARLAKAFGMQVIGCRRRAKAAKFVDRMVPPESLNELLSASDFVVLTLPSTPETTGLIGEAQLRCLRPSAWLINAARGALVDEEALLRALREKRIGGACLDVFREEPLPPESELWSMPNVIVTPHNAPGQTDDTVERLSSLFVENLRRHVAGEALLNRVRARQSVRSSTS